MLQAERSVAFIASRCPFLIAALMLSCLWMTVAAQQVVQPNAAGRLWQVGSKQLYLSCTGERHGAVVVFESGRGRTSSDWSKVQPEVSRFTMACSYDRAGMGQSVPRAATTPADNPAESVADLHALLAAAGVRPPYVLVGHSLGGLLVRWYQMKYPDEVKGLVLLDPVHEEAMWRCMEFDPQGCLPPGVKLTPEEMRRGGSLPAGEWLKWHADIPLIVVRHGKTVAWGPKAAQYEAMYVQLDQDLAARSQYGRLWVAETSGHFIQVDQPEMVVESVRDVWGAVGR